MRLKRNPYQYWIKIQRRYRKTQARWIQKQDAKLSRKLDILGRRLQALNRKWKLGIATSVLSCWLAAQPVTTAAAQGTIFPAEIRPTSLDGIVGFRLNGVNAGDQAGFAVSHAGDINGDGVDDIVIGARAAEPNDVRYAGSSYVVFGHRNGFEATIELSTLDGSNGFRIDGDGGNGSFFRRSGSSVSRAGDLNNDGIDDILIGATGGGSSYVIFGSRDDFPDKIDLSALNGDNGFELKVGQIYSLLGRSLSDAGDINGDGIDDIIIGAYQSGPNGSRSGASYVIFGKPGGFDALLELSSLDGSNGFIINGEKEGDYVGRSVSGLGDINGDGIDDLIVSAEGDDTYNNNAGSAYIVFGKESGFSPVLELSAIDGTNGFKVLGETAFRLLGQSVSSAGDINGDGLNDIIIGANNSSYVILGSNSGFDSALRVSALDGSNGFHLSGGPRPANVSYAGDLNADGVDDIVFSGGSNNGNAFIVLGNRLGFPANFSVQTVNGTNGFFFRGAGFSASYAGDIDGDGADDLILGAPRSSPNSEEPGSSYVVFGLLPPTAPTVANAIPDQPIAIDRSFSFMVPPNTFTDRNKNETQTLSAALEDGIALPSWLVFDPSTNTLSGTPTQGDEGTITIEVTVKDKDELSANDFFDLIISNAPELTAMDQQRVDLGQEISFAAQASDPDGDVLTFSLDATSLQKGMAIDASGGEFHWTPSESQGGEHEVTIIVSDGVFLDTKTLTIIVNTPPVLQAIEDQTTAIGQEISFTAQATDPNQDVLTFSLDATSLQKGMAIDASSGEFRWTPGESQGGVHEVIITVSDGVLSDAETLTIIVNSPPVLQDIENQTTTIGSEIRFTASATDPDSNPLTFSLDATSLEKGMTIDENSGQFTWTPDGTQAGTHDVTITVSDGSLTDSVVITITVNRVITSITDEVGSQVQLHPNPVEDRFQLIITNGYMGNIHLRITDLNGQVFFRQNFKKEKGTLEVEMNIGALDAGIYLVEVQDDNETILARERVMKR